MSNLRTAAQQALEALEEYQAKGAPFWACDAAVAALRAALAEHFCDTHCTWADHAAGCIRAEPGQEPVQESTCNGMPTIEGPLSRSQRMREAGFTRRPRGWVKDGDGPEQEPVAWIHVDPDKPRIKFLEWREDEPGYRGRWIKTPLFTAPPQRKPLTEEQIADIYVEWDKMPGVSMADFARAIERAHGIGGNDA